MGWGVGRVYCLIWGAKVVTSAVSTQAVPTMHSQTSWRGRTMSAIAPWLMCVLTGCASLPAGGMTPPWKKDTAKAEAAKDNIVLTSHGVEREAADSGLRAELETAKRLFLAEKYAEAEKRFHKVSQA